MSSGLYATYKHQVMNISQIAHNGHKFLIEWESVQSADFNTVDPAMRCKNPLNANMYNWNHPLEDKLCLDTATHSFNVIHID